MSPSCGLQLFTNCLSVGPSHGMQSFRNRLLQCGSPTGSQALPANLIRRGLLSPQVRRSWQEPAAARAPHRVTASFRHPPALAWGPFHRLQWISAPPWTSVDCRVTNCLTMVFIMSSRGKSLIQCLEHLLPLLHLVSEELFLSYSLTSLSTAAPHQVFPLLNCVISEALRPSLLGLDLASDGSILDPAGIGFIRHGGSFSQLLTEATS